MRRPARSRRQPVNSRADGKATVSTRQLWKAAVNDDDGSSCCMCGRAGGVCFGRTKFGCFLGRDVGVCGNVPSQL